MDFQDNRLWIYNLKPPAEPTTANRVIVTWASTPPPFLTNSKTSIVHNELDGRYYVWGVQHSGKYQDVIRVIPPIGDSWTDWSTGAWNWEWVTAGGAEPTAPQANGTYKRFGKIPGLPGWYLLNAWNQPVYVHRYAP
jgi:hypothetical protein